MTPKGERVVVAAVSAVEDQDDGEGEEEEEGMAMVKLVVSDAPAPSSSPTVSYGWLGFFRFFCFGGERWCRAEKRARRGWGRGKRREGTEGGQTRRSEFTLSVVCSNPGTRCIGYVL